MRAVHQRRAPGFTIIEMMIVVALIGIMAGVGYSSGLFSTRKPSYSGLVRAVYASLALARSTAIKRGGKVWVRFKDKTNIVVFEDRDADNQYGSGDLHINTFPPSVAGDEKRFNQYIAKPEVSLGSTGVKTFGGVPTVMFNASGFSVDENDNVLAGSITITDTGLSVGNSSSVTITAAGALRIQ